MCLVATKAKILGSRFYLTGELTNAFPPSKGLLQHQIGFGLLLAPGLKYQKKFHILLRFRVTQSIAIALCEVKLFTTIKKTYFLNEKGIFWKSSKSGPTLFPTSFGWNQIFLKIFRQKNSSNWRMFCAFTNFSPFLLIQCDQRCCKMAKDQVT